MQKDDKYKTGCVGILMPLALVGYAMMKIVWHHRKDRYKFRYRSAESIEADGITILGMALFVHALGFVPYRRYPIVKWLLLAISIVVIFYGLHGSATR